VTVSPGGGLQGALVVARRVSEEGFRVRDSRFRVQGSGFRVQGSGFRVQGSGFRKVVRRDADLHFAFCICLSVRRPPLAPFPSLRAPLPTDPTDHLPLTTTAFILHFDFPPIRSVILAGTDDVNKPQRHEGHKGHPVACLLVCTFVFFVPLAVQLVFLSFSTKRLNEQVRRNTRRFPDDFMSN
jgi:hypothetical protein